MDWRDDEHFDASHLEEIGNRREIFLREEIDVNEAYAGSLLFKAGKNSSSSLYYVDHKKIRGLSIAEKRKLEERAANAKEEHVYLTHTLDKMITKIDQLVMEPTNDKLEERLKELKKNVAILAKKVDDAKVLAINDSQKKKLKRQIQSMAGHYRKRKHLCCSFLSTLEDISDGSICKKQCLLGEGQIALDSDESSYNAAVAHSKSKKRLKTSKTLLADENFVGVVLDSQNVLKRVYIHEE